jgi:hypothetical protein
MADPLKPSMGLLSKLGSLVIHAEELAGPGGHQFDSVSFNVTLGDPEVVEWMDQMRKMALLPVKREGSNG